MASKTLVLVLALALAGCLGPPGSQAVQEGPALAAVAAGASRADQRTPTWVVGDWWNVTMRLDLGAGYRDEASGRIVVAQAGPEGFLVLPMDRPLAAFENYFDLLFVGRLTRELSPVVGDTLVSMYAWPAAPGQGWTTNFPVPVFGVNRLGWSQASLSVDATPSSSGRGVRIVGETENGELLDYDFDPVTGWFTYLRMTDAASGRVRFSLDVTSSGNGYHGPVLETRLRVLHERLRVVPPCGNTNPGSCNASLVNVPPVDEVDVAQGPTWTEEVAYLFSFPLAAQGGAAVEVDLARPDGSAARYSHADVGDRLTGTFARHVSESLIPGRWVFQYQIAGTGGFYLALFGFDESVQEV